MHLHWVRALTALAVDSLPYRPSNERRTVSTGGQRAAQWRQETRSHKSTKVNLIYILARNSFAENRSSAKRRTFYACTHIAINSAIGISIRSYWNSTSFVNSNVIYSVRCLMAFVPACLLADYVYTDVGWYSIKGDPKNRTYYPSAATEYNWRAEQSPRLREK